MWKKAVGVLLAASTFAALFYYGMTHAGAEEAMRGHLRGITLQQLVRKIR